MYGVVVYDVFRGAETHQQLFLGQGWRGRDGEMRGWNE